MATLKAKTPTAVMAGMVVKRAAMVETAATLAPEVRAAKVARVEAVAKTVRTAKTVLRYPAKANPVKVKVKKQVRAKVLKDKLQEVAHPGQNRKAEDHSLPKNLLREFEAVECPQEWSKDTPIASKGISITLKFTKVWSSKMSC